MSSREVSSEKSSKLVMRLANRTQTCDNDWTYGWKKSGKTTMTVTTSHQLTPKDLAEAIGVSESSLRRWVDSGEIRMSRTVGGHRRIPLPEAIQFIRKIGANVVRPDLLGLQLESGMEAAHMPELSDEQKLFDVLRAGQRHTARGLLHSWYLDGQSTSTLFDGPVRGAMHRMGELWNHDPRGILIEHQATEICIEAIASLRALLPAPEEHAPLALGGAPENDPYLLPTMMADAVLAEVGFRVVDFGANTPVELLAGEALQRGAKLVWLSISTPQDARKMRAAIRKLANLLIKHRIDVVLGGRHHLECAPRGLQNVSMVSSMGELAAFARGILSGKAGVK